MTTERIRLSSKLIKWLREFVEPQFRDLHVPLSDAQIVTHALLQYKANVTGREIEVKIKYNKKKKCYSLKEL